MKASTKRSLQLLVMVKNTYAYQQIITSYVAMSVSNTLYSYSIMFLFSIS